MNDIEKIRISILSRVKPTDAEKKRLAALAQDIITRIDSMGKIEDIPISAKLVGSTARGTWLSGEHDLDIFIMFPPDRTREYLEEKGLYIARKVAKKSRKVEERYAEHPYICAIFNGFDVDLVPAFAVESASLIKSAIRSN